MRKELIVDQVRGLISSLNLTNTISRRKAALIYPAEAMNTNAANALLKTLEEPPGETVIILVCSDTARLPKESPPIMTLTSTNMRFMFNKIS